jgi:hypothetical protein
VAAFPFEGVRAIAHDWLGGGNPASARTAMAHRSQASIRFSNAIVGYNNDCLSAFNPSGVAKPSPEIRTRPAARRGGRLHHARCRVARRAANPHTRPERGGFCGGRYDGHFQGDYASYKPSLGDGTPLAHSPSTSRGSARAYVIPSALLPASVLAKAFGGVQLVQTTTQIAGIRRR